MAVRSKVDPVTSAHPRAVPFTAAGVALLLAMAAIDLLVNFGFSLAFAYPGVLFMLNAGAAVVIAAVLVRGYAVAWHAGALLAASTAVLLSSFVQPVCPTSSYPIGLSRSGSCRSGPCRWLWRSCSVASMFHG